MEYSEPFEIFTSLRYDTALSPSSGRTVSPNSCDERQCYLLRNHFDRLAESIENFELDKVASQLENYESFVHYICEEIIAHRGKHDDTEGPFKVRVSMGEDGDLHTRLDPISSTPIEFLFPASFQENSSKVLQKPSGNQLWKVFLDTQPTVSTIFTSYKTNRRDMYNAARSRSLPEGTTMSSAAEVVMYNMEGDITEGSLTSLYFQRKGHWVTPPASTGCQKGTTRRWALEKGLCEEESIKANSLMDGETVIISNGARGFSIGRMVI